MSDDRPGRGGARPIYVETLIRADLEAVWRLSQTPDQHTRWDLRFTDIEYRPRPDPEAPQEFTYAVRLGPLAVDGVGRTLGERERADGTRTSALGFGSRHPLSPIADGRGYWRYVPADDDVRFLTGYDYRPAWGAWGRLADRVFRPAMGWATAWSFDRLRLWLETGVSPERLRWRAVGDAAARLGVAVLVGRATRWPWGALALVAAALAPRPTGVPSAARCRRQAPDRASASAPSTLDRVGVSA